VSARGGNIAAIKAAKPASRPQPGGRAPIGRMAAKGELLIQFRTNFN
jgi:hypothetical protein